MGRAGEAVGLLAAIEQLNLRLLVPNVHPLSSPRQLTCLPGGLQFEFRCPLALAGRSRVGGKVSARQTHTYSITLHFQLLSKAKSPQSELGFALSILTTHSADSPRSVQLRQLLLPPRWLCCGLVHVGLLCVAHLLTVKRNSKQQHIHSRCVCVCVCV